MDVEKISSHQVFTLTASATCGTSILVVASPLAGLSKQDAWISSIISITIGIPFILLYCYLGKLFPEKTLIQIINTVFGKWIGWMVSALFAIFCILSGTQVISYVGSFITTAYLVSTPVYAVNALIAAILVIALLYGLETTARTSEILFYIALIIMVLLFLANIPNVKMNNVLPVFENGFPPVVRGIIYTSSYRTWPLIILNMIYPVHVQNPKSARKAILLGYLCGAAVLFFVALMTILVLGSYITSISEYPTYLLAKQISFGFISRIEGFIVAAWIITLFYKAFCYFYAGLQGISQLFGLKEYKKIVVPLLFLALIYSNIVYPNSAYQAYWDKYVWIPYVFSTTVILSVAILLVYVIKKAYTALSKVSD